MPTLFEFACVHLPGQMGKVPYDLHEPVALYEDSKIDDFAWTNLGRCASISLLHGLGLNIPAPQFTFALPSGGGHWRLELTFPWLHHPKCVGHAKCTAKKSKFQNTLVLLRSYETTAVVYMLTFKPEYRIIDFPHRFTVWPLRIQTLAGQVAYGNYK